jgi:hypothetical protein
MVCCVRQGGIVDASAHFRRVATKIIRILEQFERNEISVEVFFELTAAYAEKLDKPEFNYIFETVSKFADPDYLTYVHNGEDPVKVTKNLVRNLFPYALSRDEFCDNDLTDV